MIACCVYNVCKIRNLYRKTYPQLLKTLNFASYNSSHTIYFDELTITQLLYLSIKMLCCWLLIFYSFFEWFNVLNKIIGTIRQVRWNYNGKLNSLSYISKNNFCKFKTNLFIVVNTHIWTSLTIIYSDFERCEANISKNSNFIEL